MRTHDVFYCAVVLGVAIASCSPSPTVDTAAEAEAIRKLSQEWNETISARDINAATAFFAPNGIQMAQNSTMLVGHNEIRQWFEAWLPDPTITNDFQTEVVEVAASGEIAYERGTYKVTVETEAGRIEAVGKYLCIWKKIDGVWKVAVDISNRDTPPAGV